MNKQSLVKFSLTLVSAAVLAACSSGGSSNNDAAKQQAAQQQQAAEAAAKAKAEAEAKAKAEAEAKAKAEAEAEAKVAAAQSVGHKLVKKTESNFILKNGESQTATSSRSTGRSDNMAVELYKSLDTVVVSVPYNSDGSVNTKAPIGYVEDFDFRGNTDNTRGAHTLNHIYKTANGATTSGAARGAHNDTTKTDTMGQQQGNVLVYQKGRTNYIPTDDKVVSGKEGFTASDTFRDRSNTVAEVYGHRTFVAGNSVAGNDAGKQAAYMKDFGADVVANNAPFLTKQSNGNYADGQLEFVQYGRVTSKLHDVDPASVKKGVNVGERGTSVVSYADYNTKGSENSYFYRGVNDTAYDANLTAKLSKAYYNKDAAEGKLTYQGHAVTYGFTHVAPDAGNKVADVPNAVGQKPTVQAHLVSGTHAHATIDLASKSVTGNLYDVWSVNNQKSNQDIATFTGTLANNGTIAGTSTRVQDKAAGTFNGNLFGSQAQELGGALASKATDAAKSWGAVFGAQVQETPYQAPVEPEAKPSRWGVQTDATN